MWSGDIARNIGSLRAQANTQMHFSLAGMDWYGSDCGGFTKPDSGLDNGDQTELYTQWFADGAMTDVPLRPHGWAIGADAQSFAPDKKGHLESNRANVWLRYALVPYTYSLAHRAFRDGEPVHPPLVYRYQDDERVRAIGNEKMIGDDLLFAMVANYGETERALYLPAGRWIGWHDRESFQGGDTQPIPTYRDGLFRLPLFARAGAIVPMQIVDGSTANLAQRDDRLAMRVFADAKPTSFTLFEDDGETVAYQHGAVRATQVAQQQSGSSVQVSIAPAQGEYAGAPSSREIRVELVVDAAHAAGVRDDAGDLPRCATLADLEATSRCFVDAGKNLIVARIPARPVSQGAKLVFALEPVARTSSVHFVCADGTTQPGESIFVVGSDPKLGAWDPQKGVPMVAVRYPRWSTVVADLPANASIDWKCVKRSDAAVAWASAQQTVATGNGGYAGTSFGSVR
jgi:alpha-glucosidase